MDRIEIFRRRADYQEARLFHFSTLEIPIQNTVKQLDILDDYLYLQSGQMIFGALDLAFMDKLSEYNNGVKYLLTCVAVFSRFVRVQPMESNNSTDAVAAFKKMLRQNNIPQKVWVDQGSEFGGEFRKFCRQKKTFRLIYN